MSRVLLIWGALLSFYPAHAKFIDDIVNKIFCGTVCVPGLLCGCSEIQNLCKECSGPGIKMEIPRCFSVKSPQSCIMIAGKTAGGLVGAGAGGVIAGATGAEIGGAVGGVAGTVVPGVGNAAGGTAGAIIGGGAGAVLGAAAGTGKGVGIGEKLTKQILETARILCKGNHIPSKNLMDKFCVAISPPQ